MHNFDTLQRAFRKQIALPWREDAPASGRVWILWYDKALENRVAGQWHLFEEEARAAGHGWVSVDVGPMFGLWMAEHELVEGLLEQPDELASVLPDFEAYAADQLKAALDRAEPNDLVAVRRCASLYGLASVSKLIDKVESSIRGRLMLSFAGRYEGSGYRLLDARPGWNYHAVPIPAEPA